PKTGWSKWSGIPRNTTFFRRETQRGYRCFFLSLPLAPGESFHSWSKRLQRFSCRLGSSRKQPFRCRPSWRGEMPLHVFRRTSLQGFRREKIAPSRREREDG